MNRLAFVLFATLFVFFTGCMEVEDQWFKPGTVEWKAVNPDFPKLAKLVANNASHKVVVGVLDSGVDYNHPYLKNNMHYNLDEVVPYMMLGQTGTDADRNTFVDDFLGYDFTGMDGFPSYRIYSKEEGGRALRMEQASLGHGTHVAGIVTQNDHRIGIIPFRVLPVSANETTLKLGGFAKDENLALLREFLDYMLKAIYLAKRGGARVLNMSLGVRPNVLLPESQLKKVFKKIRRYIHSAAPDMVVVVASGNETTDVSTGAKVYPCQLRTGNVICVGSVNKDGKISMFSNNGLQFVDIYAEGEDVVSAVPVDSVEPGMKPEEPMSGTSMASPFVAHVVARMLIEKPCLKPLDVVKLLKDTGTKKVAKLKLGNSKKEEYKYRIVNKEAAINAAKGFICPR